MARISKTLKLNNVAVVAPIEYKVSIADLSSTEGTGRSMTGLAFQDFIADKIQLDLAWNALTDDEIAPIWNAVKSAGFFPVRYRDPGEGVVTKTFYVSDRSAACYYEDPDTGESIWTGLAFQLIEQ